MIEPSNRHLLRGRQAYADQKWREAFDLLSQADEENSLDPPDLELLAVAANMLGRDDDWAAGLERAHQGFLDAGDRQQAARCALWIGMYSAARGAMGAAGGWLARAQRLLEELPEAHAERGYLLLPEMFRLEATGELAAAATVAGKAASIGQRYDDPDLFALAVHAQGQMLIRTGRVREGLALLDEAMVGATVPNVSPIVTGLVYCGVILACREVYEVGRAREWTETLSRWCEQQPDMLAFTGRCLVHRAEIFQLSGAWPDALEEARRAGRRFVETHNPAAGIAHYREAELLRLRGELGAAEDAYRRASDAGFEPQPGLAQLRLAQGRQDDAVASIRRARAEVHEPLRRAAILPAFAEIMLATGKLSEAEDACRELEEIAARYESAMLTAMTAHARGAVTLAAGEPGRALGSLREALHIWQELEAPYEIARTRTLVGQACRSLGDLDVAALELEAARACFEQLGASSDLHQLDSALASGSTRTDEHGLSRREVEVLRLVAAGHSNREIAVALVISEHTVARHVQNIFRKLDVSSRTAATAFAFEHGLV